ncbi:MAG: segregation/condensation protein A [Phycisphaerales bacterium]|nr:segregation/condensation protein A [Phycisphaerales bacterium]MCB9856398.1 segregation/condensation protein A [Phycisphaerales bacterium]MCB9864529.1 segregation/condensation protein A [Phycisphaerales bacterium]
MQEYRVQTDIYAGPMGLLLYLIRRNEVELNDIPVSTITKQYIEYVNMLEKIDPNVAGDFLIMITVLMELKAKLLLPRPELAEGVDAEEEDFGDPRLELVRQLLEYKKYKDASVQLHDRAEIQATKWPRVPAKLKPEKAGEVDLDDVQIWDLVAAFNKIMSAIGAGAATHDVVFDDTPISLHAADVVDRLDREGGRMHFSQIFAGRRRGEMVGLFLALLELMRQARVRVVQERPFDPIDIELLSKDPIQVGEEAGEGFADAVLGDDEQQAADHEAVESLAEATGASIEATWEAIDAESALDADDDDDAAERFDELDSIKTEVDVEAILKKGRGLDNAPSEDTEDDES